MRQFLVASKDATIYQYFPTNNAGLDEILEIGKVVDEQEVEPTYESGSARALLSFTLPTSGSVPTGSRYFLNLRIATSENLQRPQTVEVHLVSSSWVEGTGYFYQTPRNAQDGVIWNDNVPVVPVVSASAQVDTFPLQDIRIEVTDLLQTLVNTNGTFNGLMVKFPTTDEQDVDYSGVIRVFSTQTHTIHQPYLEVAWDDQTFVTGSLLPAPSLEVAVVPSNLRESYHKGDVSRINLTVRDRFPVKTFNAVFRYAGKYYLPETTYYSIVDTQANTTIVPFDEFSKVSCDANGVFFDLDTRGLYKGRFYTILLKVVSGNYTKTIPTQLLFKVE